MVRLESCLEWFESDGGRGRRDLEVVGEWISGGKKGSGVTARGILTTILILFCSPFLLDSVRDISPVEFASRGLRVEGYAYCPYCPYELILYLLDDCKQRKQNVLQGYKKFRDS